MFRDAVSLAAPFWRSDERWRACGLLSVILALNIALVGIEVLITLCLGALFNALAAKDWAGFISILLTWRVSADEDFRAITPGFALLAAIDVVFTTYALYLQQALQIRWRHWLTEAALDTWFAGRAYYRLTLSGVAADNPDQRIAEDVRLFVDNSLGLGIGLLRSVLTLVTFVALLWSLSKPFRVFGIAIPGYLVWVALLYSALGSTLAHLAGRRLIALNYLQQKAEANFRAGLFRVRENAESIGFYEGEHEELTELRQRFSRVIYNWRAIMAATKRLTFFTSAFGQIPLVFPYAVAAPAYFAGYIPLGGIVQTANAFVKVQGALSWIVSNYAVISGWCATVARLAGFRDAIEAANAPGECPQVNVGDRGEIGVSGLSLTLPDGHVLLENATFRIAAGSRVLLSGPSGSGKTTLFRAISGLLNFGSGSIAAPNTDRMFLPQEPYIPAGTLKRAVCYPQPGDQFPDEAVAAALNEVGLGRLAPRLDEADVWERHLSGGEKQRLALARVLLNRPRWLFMDEATSNLDEQAEAHFYETVLARLPEATVISIAHRERLARFHHYLLRLHDGRAALLDLKTSSDLAVD